MCTKSWDRSRIVLSIWGVSMVLIVLAQRYGPIKLLYNRTASVDLGFYVGQKGTQKKLVFLKPPKLAIELGCTTKHAMLLKYVVAHGGDEVCLHDRTLFVAGVPYSKTAKYGSRGQAIKLAFTGCIDVPKGHVFVATPHPNSCDSRLFGPQPLTQIWGGATALYTWR